MNPATIAALITAVVGGIASLVTVYINLKAAISRAKKDTHEQVVSNYQDMLARSTAQAEVFRQEIRLEKDEAKKDIAEAKAEARADLHEAREFFARQLEAVVTEFTTTLRAERRAAREEAAENRRALASLVEQNAEEHRAIVASINELRGKMADVSGEHRAIVDSLDNLAGRVAGASGT